MERQRMGSDFGGSAVTYLCRKLHQCGKKGSERVRPSIKQSVAALSCGDSTGVGTPVPRGQLGEIL